MIMAYGTRFSPARPIWSTRASFSPVSSRIAACTVGGSWPHSARPSRISAAPSLTHSQTGSGDRPVRMIASKPAILSSGPQ